MIPAQTASYTIRVFELNNAPASYRFMVMTLDEQQLTAPTEMEPDMFATGQRDAAALATGQFNVHHYRGTPFQPVLVFVESDDTTVQSIGARPVLVWVNPHGQGDVVIRIADETGATIADVNLQSGGFPEVAYALPVAMTTYNVHISGTGGVAVTYDLMIVTLD